MLNRLEIKRWDPKWMYVDDGLSFADTGLDFVYFCFPPHIFPESPISIQFKLYMGYALCFQFCNWDWANPFYLSCDLGITTLTPGKTVLVSFQHDHFNFSCVLYRRSVDDQQHPTYYIVSIYRTSFFFWAMSIYRTYPLACCSRHGGRRGPWASNNICYWTVGPRDEDPYQRNGCYPPRLRGA